MRVDKVTLQTILALGYTAYASKHRLPDYARRAVWAILVCRTAVLGGHVQACPDGHVERIWYNSCRHRMCPQCAWVQIERWLAKQRARLLTCEDYHVIFTIPHELHALWLANVEVMSGLLFASVHDTLLELLGDRKYLGATPGMIATLHTWSQTLLLHPHIHCLVTGGGLSETGQWVAVRNGFLLPMAVVMALFRGKLLAAIRQGVAQGQLTLPEGQRRQQLENRLNQLGRTKWNVHIRERYAYGQGVLIYLARYLRGGPIAQRRLLACDGQQVVLGYEERAKGSGGQATQRTMRLSVEQFIGRWRLHVPPARAVRVRCWGLYAHTHAEVLARCRRQWGQGPEEVSAPLEGPDDDGHEAEASPACCPVCGQRLVCTALIPRAGVPPPAQTGWQQVA
ncbi:MAG TPA: transposase [Candidatus Tectomicrobia bacterium]|nr:transposase [Candidatus Tectomicrobia bacterium]